MIVSFQPIQQLFRSRFRQTASENATALILFLLVGAAVRQPGRFRRGQQLYAHGNPLCVSNSGRGWIPSLSKPSKKLAMTGKRPEKR
jgi:hypothetical protein